MQRNGLSLRSPAEAQRALAGRARDLRLHQGLKQSTLASRAGVTLASLRRFEQTGEASLKLLIRIANALGRLDDLEGILIAPPAQTLAELESQVTAAARKRGRR